jgi:hypothetical protein
MRRKRPLLVALGVPSLPAERLLYDWSDPHRVVITATDTNVWGRASGHTYTLIRKPEGITAMDVVVVREGKNVRGGVCSGSWLGSAAGAA